jgi:hypothetical protein
MVLNQDKPSDIGKDELHHSSLDVHQVKRSKSVIVNNNMFSFNRKANTQAPTSMEMQEYVKPEKVILTRQIMFNILLVLLRDFSNIEMRLVNFNHPLQSMRAYLQSNLFQSHRYAQSLKSISTKSAGANEMVKIDPLG